MCVGGEEAGGGGVSHLVAPLEDVLVAIAEGAVDVEELEDAVLPHVLRVPPRLLPAQRRALRQQPHAGPRRSREEEGERRTENGAGAEPARRGVRSAPRQRRREPSPAPHVTAAARQAVTQHFPATGPAPLEAGAPPRPPRSASARGEGEGPAVADSPQRPAGKSDYGGKWGSAGGV